MDELDRPCGSIRFRPMTFFDFQTPWIRVLQGRDLIGRACIQRALLWRAPLLLGKSSHLHRATVRSPGGRCGVRVVVGWVRGGPATLGLSSTPMPGWLGSDDGGETAEERETRLAAEEVHRRLHAIDHGHREANANAAAAADGFVDAEPSSVRRIDRMNAEGAGASSARGDGARRASVRTDEEREREGEEVSLAEGVVSRLGVDREVGMRVASEVLSAERRAVLAVVGAARVRAGQRPPPPVPLTVATAAFIASSEKRTARRANANADQDDGPRTAGRAFSFQGADSPASFRGQASDSASTTPVFTTSRGGGGSSSPLEDMLEAAAAAAAEVPDSPATASATRTVATPALWSWGHTPPPTAARSALGYRCLAAERVSSSVGRVVLTGDGMLDVTTVGDESEGKEEKQDVAEMIERATGMPGWTALDPAAAVAAATAATEAARREADAARAAAERVAAIAAVSQAAQRTWVGAMGTRQKMAVLSDAAAAAVVEGMHRLDLRNPAPLESTFGGGDSGVDRGEEELLADEFAAMIESIAARPDPPAVAAEDARDLPREERVSSPIADQSHVCESPQAQLPQASDELPWSPADVAAVRAARAAAARADAAAAAVLEEERRARAAVTQSVSELLDARVGLVAATARAVAEEAAFGAVGAAAEAASLKITLRDADARGNPDDATSEALAGFIKRPLSDVLRMAGGRSWRGFGGHVKESS